MIGQVLLSVMCLVVLAMFCSGCAGSAQGNANDFRAARDAYVTCAKERGADNCAAERDVMRAAAIR